ncbi:MAG TPA: hypothetical protein VM099_10795 [Gemmatimonadaceae bacterium]|nr:hypothetical protein [Gemmatimonadaceae bacterium]
MARTSQAQRVEGQVVKPGAREMIPVPRIMVTLHRVGSDRAAPLDSTRAYDQGKFAFSYQRSGDSSAVYFVSAIYGGIAYFTPPLTDSVVKGEGAEIAVYDTTSGPVPIGVRGHHVVVSAVDANSQRAVTEVYELANDTTVTRIARGADTGGPVWTALVPPTATGFQVAQGDIPAAAVAFRNSHVSVFAPIAPGLAQLAFTYNVPASSFPLSVPVQQPTQILEVLVEDEKGSVTGAKLTEKDPVVLERRSFRRFLADDVPQNEISVIDLPAAVRTTIDPRYLVALTLVIGTTMIIVLARALRRS